MLCADAGMLGEVDFPLLWRGVVSHQDSTWNSHVGRESGTVVKDGKDDQFQLLEDRLRGAVLGLGRRSGLMGRKE